MTIKLTSAEEQRLVLKLAEGFENVEFQNDFTRQTDFAWADALFDELPDDAKNKIDRYVGDRSLSRFIEAEIDHRFSIIDVPHEISKGSKASDVPFLRSPMPFCKELVETLKSLPFRYRVTTALPAVFGQGLEQISRQPMSLPSGITLTRGDGLPSPLPVTSPFPRLDSGLFHDWLSTGAADREIRDDLFYLSVPMNGYLHARESSSLARSIEDHMRAFFGAGLAVKLLSYGWNAHEVQDGHGFVMIHDEATRELLDTQQLEDEIKSRLNFSSTSDFAIRHRDKLEDSFKSAIRLIGTVFGETTDCNKLFSACVWYYRAKINRRPLDALLQATIAIEVLLGDRKASEGIGLTNLLESRCAYLLGKSSSNRASIAANFRKVYDLRSKVVHDGRHSLRTGDRDIVNIALNLCASIINRELRIRSIDSATN